MDKSKFSDELPDELYPKLNNEHIARLSQVGMRRSVPAQILFDPGTIGRHFYTGELDMLSGRLSLVNSQSLGR